MTTSSKDIAKKQNCCKIELICTYFTKILFCSDRMQVETDRSDRHRGQTSGRSSGNDLQPSRSEHQSLDAHRRQAGNKLWTFKIQSNL